MNKIDEIEPSKNTEMTDELIRIFKSVGCDPACHACEKGIKSGEIFKLVPHPTIDRAGHPMEGFSDEMCCDKCGTHHLTLRDKRWVRAHKKSIVLNKASGGTGFSRPSKM